MLSILLGVKWSLSALAGMPASVETRRFEAAVTLIQSLPPSGPFQPSNELKLRLYGLFKQAKEGPCTAPKPGFWDVVSRAKWEAWKSLGSLSPEDAMRGYVSALRDISDALPLDEKATTFLALLGEGEAALPSAAEIKELVNGKAVPVHKANGAAVRLGNGHVAFAANGASAEPPQSSGVSSDSESETAATAAAETTNNPLTSADSVPSEDEAFCDATDALPPIVAEDSGASALSSLSSSPQRDEAEGPEGAEEDDIEEAELGRASSAEEVPPHLQHLLAQSWEAVRNLSRSRRRRLWETESPLVSLRGRQASGTRKARGHGEGSNRGSGGGGSNGAGSGPPSARQPARQAVLAQGQEAASLGAPARSGSESSGGSSPVELSWDPALAGVLFRVNRQLQGISRQLELMERILLAQQRLIQANVDALVRLGSERRLWFFGNLPWRTILFILAWPVVLHFAFKLLSRPGFWLLLRRRRK